MTERVDISTARGRLKELVERAAMGEEIILTRYNKDTARIVGLDWIEGRPIVKDPGAGQPLDAVAMPSRADVSTGKVSFGPVDPVTRDAILNKIATRKRK